jgi:hypothetical protein
MNPRGAASSIAIAPVTVSDRTCVATLGVPWRALRAWCGAHRIPIGRIGRRPCVRVDHVLATLEGGAETQPAAPWSVDLLVAADRKAGPR